MWYYRRLPDGLIVMQTRPEHAADLEDLQRTCFPTLADAERFKAPHYLKHIELFPDGQFVVLDGDRLVGATTTLRLDFDFDHIDHTFADIIRGGWLTSHEPKGAWMYGADIGVDPAYRGRGLATALYAARQEAVWRLGLKGQVTAGMLRGYGAVKDRMPAEDYYRRVVAGEIKDPTLSMQLAIGFEPRALLANYLNDPACDNYSALIVLDAGKPVTGASRQHAVTYIRVHTAIPGPRARDLIARREAAVPAGLGRATDVVVERASESMIFDVDGNALIDFAGGIGMLAVGHSPAPVVGAIVGQARKYIHPCALVTTYEPYVRLAEVLNEITPGTFRKKTILASGGAEAVENAVKLARRFTGRPAVICFEGGYHGRTLLTLSLTSKYSLFKSGFGPFAPEIVRLPIPHLFRRPAGMTEDQYVDFGIRQLEAAMVSQVDPSAVAAMIIEPVQGEAGFVPVPPRFLTRIRELCDTHGIVMIADEVQCGMGRTGRLFAVDSAHPGGVGSTYGGSPLACAAALEAVAIIRTEAFLAHARHLGDVMREVMEGWKAAWPFVGDVRGLGPMMIAELVRDRDAKTPATPDETLQVVRQAVANGVVVMRAGLYSNCVRLLPPLTMPEDMLREGLTALERAVEAVALRVQAAAV
jgi:4-aminobutyrate aminotransferase/(S)-3-amino-2-methylpropionate transaminase